MTWASRRQVLYLLGTLIVVGVLFGIPLFVFFYEEPTCRDGVQNGLEEGVDCGGACDTVCDFRAVEPIIHWAQEFQVTPGVYTSVALVENANDAYETVSVPYVFRLYDSKNVFVTERKGNLYLPPHTIVPVFETGLYAGERVPTRVDFQFEKDIVWTRSSFEVPDVDIVSRRFDEESTLPRLFVTLKNNTLESFLRVPVVVILYDATDNALHASRTVVPNIPPSQSVDVTFTWPAAFSSPVARIDVLPVFASN